MSGRDGLACSGYAALTCKSKSNQWIDARALFRFNVLFQGKLEVGFEALPRLILVSQSQP